jgi:hypothetical protein
VLVCYHLSSVFIQNASNRRFSIVTNGCTSRMFPPEIPAWRGGCKPSISNGSCPTTVHFNLIPSAWLQNELLNGEIFYAPREAQIIIESGCVITTRSALMHRSATNHLHRRSSCQFLQGGCFATSPGFAGHASAISSAKLTFCLDHSMWAAQFTGTIMGCGGKE